MLKDEKYGIHATMNAVKFLRERLDKGYGPDTLILQRDADEKDSPPIGLKEADLPSESIQVRQSMSSQE